MTENKGDLISREALKKDLHNFFDGKIIDEPTYILRDVFCHIDNAPTIDAIVNTIEVKPQGKWIDIGNTGACNFCSVCKEFVLSTHLNFCSNCGADMRGKEE